MTIVAEIHRAWKRQKDASRSSDNSFTTRQVWISSHRRVRLDEVAERGLRQPFIPLLSLAHDGPLHTQRPASTRRFCRAGIDRDIFSNESGVMDCFRVYISPTIMPIQEEPSQPVRMWKRCQMNTITCGSVSILRTFFRWKQASTRIRVARIARVEFPWIPFDEPMDVERLGLLRCCLSSLQEVTIKIGGHKCS